MPFRAAVVAGLFRWSRRCRSKTRQQWLVGYIYHYLYSHCNLFFGSFGRKECLNTPRPVHHELAVTVSHRATPIPSPQLSGWRGLTLYASVEEADHQCWLYSSSINHCIFFVSFLLNIAICTCTIYQSTNYVYYGEICIFAPIIA